MMGKNWGEMGNQEVTGGLCSRDSALAGMCLLSSIHPLLEAALVEGFAERNRAAAVPFEGYHACATLRVSVRQRVRELAFWVERAGARRRLLRRLRHRWRRRWPSEFCEVLLRETAMGRLPVGGEVYEVPDGRMLAVSVFGSVRFRRKGTESRSSSHGMSNASRFFANTASRLSQRHSCLIATGPPIPLRPKRSPFALFGFAMT